MRVSTSNSQGRVDTQSISIPAHVDTVFSFVADPANLPVWAVGFAQAIRRDGSQWVVRTTQGEIEVQVRADESAGTIDFHLFPIPGESVVAFSRVVPNGDGCEYVFTQLQSNGMPDHIFEAQVRALGEELNVLRGVMAARAACPA